MTGLEWSRRFWHEVAAPALERDFPDLAGRIAAGLVGNGSECFGFDDEYSRDHDWGTEFFLWLPEGDAGEIPALSAWKQDLLAAHPEYPQRVRSPHGGDVGVMTCGDFYRQLLGCEAGPRTVREWFSAPEENLAMAVNGEVFRDGAGIFTAVREHLLRDYPEDLRRKRIAARCMMLAQTGQYNLDRCLRRDHRVSAAIAAARFVEEAIWLVFLLNRTYKPYYNWAFPAMERLPRLAGEIGPLLEELTALGGWSEETCRTRRTCVDRICALFVDALRREGLSDATDWFLAAHGEAVQATIQDPLLRQLPPQVG